MMPEEVVLLIQEGEYSIAGYFQLFRRTDKP